MSLKTYFQEALSELHRVTWPTRKQAINSTIIVLAFTLVVSLVITLIDWGMTLGVKELLFRF